MIPYTRPSLPSRARLESYIDGIYERCWLTNNGPLVQELTRRLRAHLGVEHLLLVGNGTLALQVAYRALGLCDEVSPRASGGLAAQAITTPFTFVATASALKWEGFEPVFVDIDPHSWCLDPARIEAALNEHTRVIAPVHVFGNPCQVEAIDAIAARHQLPVVYDAAHAFGVTYRGRSLLRWGDAATLSFHATKVFHTIEGGAIVFRRREHLERAKRLINFGITGPERIEGLGINAKMNEFQAAMGLCLLDEADGAQGRARAWQAYQLAFQGQLRLQRREPLASNNHGYFPVLLSSEAQVLDVMAHLGKAGIEARRYFCPSLDEVFESTPPRPMPISADVSRRILCLPIYEGLDAATTGRIIALLRQRLMVRPVGRAQGMPAHGVAVPAAALGRKP